MKVRMMIGVMCAVALLQTGYPSVADAKGGHGGGHHGGGHGHDGGHQGADMGQKVRAHGPGHGRGLGLGRGGGRRGGRAMRRHQRVLNKFDVNHDGVLDATESAQWQIVKERRRQQKQLMLQQGLPPGQTIAKQKKIK
jgi:hypothetical protein